MDMNWRELKSVVYFVLHRMETTLDSVLAVISKTPSTINDDEAGRP